MDSRSLKDFSSRVLKELDKNLLPFWTEKTLDRRKGGFIGFMDSQGRVIADAPKGLVLNARFLWTWSSLTRRREASSSKSLMDRAYRYLTERFADSRFGGYFWTLDRDGKPLVDQKKTYGQAFVLYALSEYVRTTASEKALERARALFDLIENRCRDPHDDGYFETFERDWTPSEDMRLSEVDMDEKKSMNTHLHLLEAYATLYRVWRDSVLAQRLDSLLGIFFDRIIDPRSGHFRLFFDEGWASKSDRISYGHDIEGCWLVSEAAEVLGNPSRIDQVRRWSTGLASRILETAWDDVHGGIFNEGGPSGIVDRDKIWWVQAEAVVGFLHAFSKSGDKRFFNASRRTWEFIENVLADREFGEWQWKVSAENRPDLELPKVSEWKCPYHSVRVCLETIERLAVLQQETKTNHEGIRMDRIPFEKQRAALLARHRTLIARQNRPCLENNGFVVRWQHPILTADHTPVFWRYDLNPKTNPQLLERMGINSVFNPGAIEHGGKILLVARVEGADRKSFFAIAESKTGVDRFAFWDLPVVLPQTDSPDINVYDMRLVRHEDGWIYGLFCTERKDTSAPREDTSSATAQCGIVRTHDLKNWERLPDLKTRSPQQRNVVLHPEFILGRYAFYTRPQDGFIEAGTGGGIGWGLADDITRAVIDHETIVDDRQYHTIKEAKNGLGPAPIKTRLGWLQLAHGVRNTAAGLRYVLYLFVTDLDDPSKVIHAPGGYLLAPQDEERIGDVSNVLFSCGWVVRGKEDVFIYYASSDTRIHVATTTVEKLLDYALNTPPDPLQSAACVQDRITLIVKNRPFLKTSIIKIPGKKT